MKDVWVSLGCELREFPPCRRLPPRALQYWTTRTPPPPPVGFKRVPQLTTEIEER